MGMNDRTKSDRYESQEYKDSVKVLTGKIRIAIQDAPFDAVLAALTQLAAISAVAGFVSRGRVTKAVGELYDMYVLEALKQALADD